jgi:hypothetical protein
MEFQYTDQQWSRISQEAGRNEVEDRDALQSFAAHCLERGNPQQVRTFYRDRKRELETLSKAFLDFVSTMESLKANDETEFIIKEASQFKIGDMRAHGKRLLMVSQNTMVVDYMFGPSPKGQEDHSRKEYLRRLCRFWEQTLRRKAKASTDEIGNATGPMVRFLKACSDPVFALRNLKPLTALAARSEVRSYNAWKISLTEDDLELYMVKRRGRKAL